MHPYTKNVLILDGSADDLPEQHRPSVRLGIMKVAGGLVAKGIGVSLDPRLDAFSVFTHSEVEEMTVSHSDQFAGVALSLPYVSGDNISGKVSYSKSVHLAQMAVRQGLRLVAGGAYPTIAQEAAFAELTDGLTDDEKGRVLVVSGFGEGVIADAFREGVSDEDLRQDSRFGRFSGGKFISGVPQVLTPGEISKIKPYVPNLPYIPSPNLQSPVIGCPFKCNYCTSYKVPTANGCLDQLSPEYMLDELRVPLGAIRGSASNDMFAVPIGWWEKYLQLLKDDPDLSQSQCFFQLAGYTNISTLTAHMRNPKFHMIFRALRLNALGIGLESFDPNVLHLAGRPPVDIAAVKEVIKFCFEAGVSPKFDIILGLPGANEKVIAEDILRMVDIASIGGQFNVYSYQELAGSRNHKDGVKGHNYDFASLEEIEEVRQNTQNLLVALKWSHILGSNDYDTIPDCMVFDGNFNFGDVHNVRYPIDAIEQYLREQGLSVRFNSWSIKKNIGDTATFINLKRFLTHRLNRLAHEFLTTPVAQPDSTVARRYMQLWTNSQNRKIATINSVLKEIE